MRILNAKQRRRAAHAVEFAVVCPVVLLLLFGILEYCRYLMTLQVSDNAVREGARYALARTDTFQTNLTTAGIQTYVTTYMNSAGMQLSNPQILVYKSDKYGQPLDINDNVVSSPSLAATFDQTMFGDYICVQITGTYQPVLPSFMSLAPNITVTSTAVMCSEGN
jgi:Flp pilus assembly protein TadG